MDDATELWNTILKERITGYSHRKPKSREKKKKDITQDAVIIKIVTPSFDQTNQLLFAEKTNS